MDTGRVEPVIRILPADEVDTHSPTSVNATGDDPLGWARHVQFMPSARLALEHVLRNLALEPADEILITNSSGQTYISACVTCHVFNHCQPSRVLTERTRAIVAIHEYGYPHPHLAELIDAARDRGIPLIEDCAHSLDSTLGGAPLGSFGDFAIFSLPKVFPVRAGGILATAAPRAELPPQPGGDDGDAAAAFLEHAPALDTYSERRRRNADAIRRSFPDLPLLLEPGAGVTPFSVCLLTPEARPIRQRSSAVEWGSTLRDDLLLVTTNPFVDSEALVAALGSALERSVVV
jgi:hypothetical protein